jgi:acyl-CoA reductase-like NAD-dependent aldehyde dehydrogenase
MINSAKAIEFDERKLTLDQIVECVDKKQDRLQNAMHMEHRMDVWQQKLDKVQELSALIDANPDLVDDEMIETAE